MTAAATVAREALTTLLDTALTGVQVYEKLPSQLTLPCVTIEPGSPWITGVLTTGGVGYRVGFDIVASAAPTAGTAPAWADLEDLVDQVLAAVDSEPSILTNAEIDTPAQVSLGAVDVFQARVPVHVIASPAP